MHARIDEDARVVELIHHDPLGKYHPSITWLPVPESLEPWVKTHGWVASADQTRVEPDTLASLVDQMNIKLADKRWTRQSAGVVFNATTWHSDAAGRAAINEAITLAERYEAVNGAGSWSSRWKAKSGFIQVDLTSLTAAGLAVGAFVQACFAREGELAAALSSAASAADATAADVIVLYDAEIDQGWPSRDPASAS